VGCYDDHGLVLKMLGVGEKYALIEIYDGDASATAQEEYLILMAVEVIRGSIPLAEGANIEIGVASFKFRFFCGALAKEHEHGFRKGSSLR